MPENLRDEPMESSIKGYIRGSLLSKPELQLENDTLLFESRILDSLSLLKLVLFLEQQFGVVVPAEELIPDNFKTIDAMCAYLRSKKGT